MTIRSTSPHWLRCLSVVAATSAGALMVLADPSHAQESEPPGGLTSPFNPTDRDGIPLDHYVVTADTGSWYDVLKKAPHMVTELCFSLTRTLVGFAKRILEWALDFTLLAKLFDGVQSIATTFQERIVDPIGLPAFMLALAATWMAWQVLFRSRARGFTEGGVSVLVFAVGATWLASPATTLLGSDGEGGVAGYARCFTLAVASLPFTDAPPAEPDYLSLARDRRAESSDALGGRGDPDCETSEEVTAPISDMLIETFVRVPHQLINYGVVFDSEVVDPECGAAYWAIVREGGDREAMEDAGESVTVQTGSMWLGLETTACAQYAEYNKKPSWDRAIAAFLTLVAALIVVVLIVLAVASFLMAQLWLALEVVRGVVVLPIGILPGSGRALLWKWVGGVFRAILGIIVSIVFLSIFSLLLRALLVAMAGEALVMTFVALDIAVFAGLIFHRRLTDAAKQAGSNLAARLHQPNVGAPDAPWVRPAPAAAPSFGRQGNTELKRATRTVQRTGQGFHQIAIGSLTSRRKAQAKWDRRHSTFANDSDGSGADAKLSRLRSLERATYGTRAGRYALTTAYGAGAVARKVDNWVYVSHRQARKQHEKAAEIRKGLAEDDLIGGWQ